VTGSDPRYLADLTEAQRGQAMARWQVLRPHIEDEVPLTRLARQCGVAGRTLQRWAARYRADGMAGLARSERADRGARRFPDQVQLLMARSGHTSVRSLVKYARVSVEALQRHQAARDPARRR
jgi:putative transposase